MARETADLVIVGAGAAGLAAAIFAGEAAAGAIRILMLEGARKPGAKILVSGGGRCNVTHREVTPDDYAGGSPNIIRNVLRAFDEQRTLAWMRSLGVDLKLEPTGKYFPKSDAARTVLEALLTKVRHAGVELRSGVRVLELNRVADGFEVVTADTIFAAPRVILATGGLALPKSGSDGTGLRWAEALGHSIIPTTPALAPLVLRANDTPGGRFADLSGLTIDARLSLHARSGKRLRDHTGSLLFTHFGLSGPVAMDLSRHIARHRLEHGEEPLVTLGHPQFATVEAADAWLVEAIRTNPKRQAATIAMELYPERLARLLTEGLERLADLSRPQRQELARRLAALPLSVAGDRGYTFAETTAGGVDLREIDARTMESRKVPSLHLCGEILDVDGRIGGFNFQWAWASGYLAGRGAVAGGKSAKSE